MFKRTCAIILTLALLTGLMFTDSLAVEATSGTIVQSGDWEYTVADDGTARIVGFCGIATNVVVPNQIDGYQVTTIATYAFYDCDTLEDITLPEGLIRIGSFAFSYCDNLINITLPESLENIYSYAFEGCKNLQSVILPEGLKEISDYAFCGCSSIKSITLPQGVNSIESGVFSECSSLTNVVISAENITWRDGSTFKGCSSLKSITLPEGIPGIPAYSFDGCSSLQEIVVPESVTYIGKYAFSNCTSLQSIMLSDNVNSIGEYAFSGCSSLKSMQLPKKLTKINTGTFDGCTKLKNITFSEELSEIGACAFSECSNLTNIVLPPKLTKIGGSAFFNCYGLTNIILPEGIISIEYGTFYGCLYLTHIALPENLKSIGEFAFQYCTRLTSITLPDSVTSIGEGAFYHCKRLESIILPKGVTSIESCVFQGCGGLKEIVVSDSVTSIGSRAFADCSSLESIILPESVISVDYQAFYMCDNVTIYGETDSYIQTYAIENEIPFKHVYWVTYDACGGMEAPTTHVKLEDKSVNLSENIPNYAEHKFLGWSTYPAGEIEYLPGENYNENADLELYALWDAGHTVTYHINDGTNVFVTQKKYHGEVLQLKNPTRDGYAFKGWSTEPTGDVLYQPGMNYEKDEDITLYAVWVKKYFVAYDTAGGSGTINTQYFEVNENAQISEKIPSRIGYIFLGWSDTSSGEVNFQPGDIYSQNKDVTLYAVWEPIYTVNYDANGGYGAPASQVQRKGETLILASTIPYKSECVFLGWSTSRDGIVLYANGATYREESDITLYAQWGNFECLECNGDGVIQEQCKECKGNGTIKEPSVCVKCSGTGKELIAIDNWSPCQVCNGNKPNCANCDGKGQVYAPEYLRVPCSQCDETGVSYDYKKCPICLGEGEVSWQCNQCDNGSTQEIFSVQYYIDRENVFLTQTKYGNVALALSQEVPVHLGVQFLGWATSFGGKIEYYPSDTYLEDEDLQLYAVWSGAIPSAPTVSSYTDTKVILIPLVGGEYSLDGINWQTSNVFMNLSPSTEYTFYQRYAETDTHEASVTSRGTSVTTDKSKQTLIPNAPIVQSITVSSITLVAVEGCEYSKDGITWQSSPVFDGLSCGTKYTFYQRYKETADTYTGNKSDGVIFRTDKGTQTAPPKPTLLSRTHNSVTLTKISGYEYSMDGITWQTSNVFIGLNPETNYLFYQRKAENDRYYASSSSTSLTVKTDEAPQYITGDFNNDNAVTDADALYLHYHTISGDTYSIEQDCDYNQDGVVTDADALYLLYHTIFGDSYPLSYSVDYE